MNVADLVKLIGDGLTAAGKTKVPVVLPGTPASVIPCVVLAPSDDELVNANKTLRYGFNIRILVPRSSQVDQYQLLVELQAIVLQSIIPSQVQFDGPMPFDPTVGETIGEPPALARVIPVTFTADVDLCA
jgi:hypothetical protein